jgi:hypothetical protein
MFPGFFSDLACEFALLKASSELRGHFAFTEFAQFFKFCILSINVPFECEDFQSQVDL